MTKSIACATLVLAFATIALGRNVVLLVGDDHGLELGCYGHPVVKTPALDRLAASGVRFTNAFATVASCSASRSVLLTGFYNHTNGQFGHAHHPHNLHTHAKVRSLPALLKEAGYRTGVIGKLHVLPRQVYTFDEEINVPGGPRSVIKMAELARRFIEKDPDKPFFILMGYVDPHRGAVAFDNDKDYPGVEQITYKPEEVVVPPYLPDSPECRRELAEYCQSVSRLDQGVGAMLDMLAETKHADDTLVIYLSDNGIPWPGAKTTLYEPGIHLPLLISSPRQTRRGLVNPAMVNWADVAPTILDWAEAKPPAEIPGRSILPILETPDPQGWDTVFGSHTFHEITMYYPMRMIRTRKYKYILNLAHQLPFPFASDLWESPTWQGVLKRGDTKYGRRSVESYVNRPREELYDLEKDPDELRNLAADPNQAATLADLRRRLREWQEKTQDPWLVKYTYE